MDEFENTNHHDEKKRRKREIDINDNLNGNYLKGKNFKKLLKKKEITKTATNLMSENKRIKSKKKKCYNSKKSDILNPSEF